MAQRFDYPPVWLLAALALAWGARHLFPIGAGQSVLVVPGWGLVLVAGALMGAAAARFLRHRTTIVPHRKPAALITDGLYRYSRNPIYLADVLLLAGLIMVWGAHLAWPLVPLLAWVLQRRFILPEEARLRAAFGQATEQYFARTRRWI